MEKYKNYRQKSFIVIIFIFIASGMPLAAAGSSSKNNAKLAPAIGINNDNSILVFYQDNEYLYIDEYTVNRDTRKIQKIKNENNMFIKSESDKNKLYSQYLSNGGILFINGNTLSGIDISQKKPVKIAENVKQAVFTPDRCFFLSADGSFHLYNPIDKEIKKMFDCGPETNGYLEAVKKQEYKNMLEQDAKSWLETKIDGFSSNNPDVTFTDAEKHMINRYALIMNNPDSGITAEEWISSLRQDLEDNRKSEESASDILKNNNTIPENLKYRIAYRDGNINVLLDYTENIDLILPANSSVNTNIRTYNKLLEYKTGSYSQNSKAVIERLKNDVKEEIETYIKTEYGKIMLQSENYRNAIKDLKKEYTLNNIKADPFSGPKGGFDFFPADEEYIVFCKRIEFDEEYYKNFASIGQKMSFINISDNGFFVIENGRQYYYNAFNLEKKETSFRQEGEVLFAVPGNGNITVTRGGQYQIKNSDKSSALLRNDRKSNYAVDGLFYLDILPLTNGKSILYVNTENNSLDSSVREDYIYIKLNGNNGLVMPMEVK
ncbi:MAG: hypothetical protein LBE10_11510 [Treponema sp.]|jgi:hypothetical protein|nr:hypothetical protein [Treponema sp.]